MQSERWEKAKESLEAVERLLDTRDGEVEPLNNAAASRAYYAAYGAVCDRMLRKGVPMPASGYFQHRELPEKAFYAGVLSRKQRSVLEWLRDLRVEADYTEAHVHYDDAARAAEHSTALLQILSEVS